MPQEEPYRLSRRFGRSRAGTQVRDAGALSDPADNRDRDSRGGWDRDSRGDRESKGEI
jgi:hypothetical protein